VNTRSPDGVPSHLLEGGAPSPPGGRGEARFPEHVPTTRLWLAGAAYAILIATVYAYGSYAAPLTEPDETRYAEIAREMLVRGDWVTPHLNFVKYFEKPPLVYWGTAAAFVAFGVGELSARLPSLLSAIATIALTVWLAARMYGASTALLALPIIAVGPLFGLMAQTLVLDTSLTFCVTLAMVGVWLGFASSVAAPTATARRPPSAMYRVAYAATALAVLVKGPVAAVLVGASALLFLALHGGWRVVRPALDWRGFALAAAIVLPWFIVVSWRNPEFLHFFVVDQHIARYLWTTEHGEPIWFFVPVIPLALAPWGLAVLLDPPLLRAALAPRAWSVPSRFLIIWAAVIVGFFSLSTSKLLTYVLPAMPPLAILTARALLLGIEQGRTRGVARLSWALLIMGPLMSLCGAVLPFLVTHWRMPAVTPYLIAGGPLLLATGWCTRRALAGGRSYAALAALSVGWLAIFAVAAAGRGVANQYKELGLALRAAATPEDRVAMYASFTHGIAFYAERRVIMLRSWGELKFGSQQGEQSDWFWPSLDDLRREWAAPGRLFVVINRKDLDGLDPPLQPAPTVVAAQGRKLVVVNR
jgi:4-amino-4-deoxy-L-arabinose transferase-like glycosyltransferase